VIPWLYYLKGVLIFPTIQLELILRININHQKAATPEVIAPYLSGFMI